MENNTHKAQKRNNPLPWHGVLCRNRAKRVLQGLQQRRSTSEIRRFKNEHFSEVYEKRFKGRDIAYGKGVDFKSFEGRCPYIYDWFNAQGWVVILESVDRVYPELVREFYTHLDCASLQSNGCLTSWVRGKEIILTEHRLSELFHLPTGGVFDSLGKKWSTHKDFNTEECMQLLLSDNNLVGRKRKPDVNELDWDVRLLHLIISRTIIPRIGNKSSITFLDVFIMYCVLKKKVVNMPKLMLHYMASAAIARRSCLCLMGCC